MSYPPGDEGCKAPRCQSWLLLFVTLGIVSSGGTAPAGENAPAWLAHNDVIYAEPARNGWEGLPLGNGTLGAQVWNPDGLTFQLNTPWSGALGFSIARIHLLTAPGLLSDVVSYRQRLSLSDATLLTEIETGAGPIRIKSWIAAGADVLVIEVDDRRTAEIEQTVEIETWHPTAKHEIRPDRIVTTDQPAGAQRVDYPCALAVAVADGAKVQAVAIDANLSRLQISSHSYTVLAAFAGARDPKADVAGAAQALLDRCRTQGVAAFRAEHDGWWAKLWSRSYIQLDGPEGTPDYLANLWYVHVYAMASGSRGDVAPKFNGGLWTFLKDEREWGAGYWHWNTQETYWPLYAAGQLELLDTYYKMYFAMLPRAQQQTKDYFGTPGAHYGETIMWDGTDASGKGPKKSGVHPRLPIPITPAHTNLILSSSAEIAMQFWWRYLYTGDRQFLQEKAYPLMRAVTEFFVAYLEKGADGRYNMYPSNAHETFFQVKNPATDLAALRYLIPTVIKASEVLGVDAELRPVWQDRLDHLAPWSIDPKTQGIANYEPRPGEKIELSNAENPDVFPMGVFPLIRLGTPDFDLGLRTFLARKYVNVYGWTTDSVAAARLGLRDDLEKLLPLHAEYYQDHPSGLMDYYDRKPALHAYLEASGVFATGLGEMLLQSWPATPGETEPIVRICPALPSAWDARFKLLAVGGFEVECVAEKGQPRMVAITSTRGGVLHVVNPFDKLATVSDAGRELLTSADPVLTVPTEAGHVYSLTAGNEAPPKVGPLPLAAGEAAKQLKAGSRRWLGKPASAIVGWKPPVESDAPQPPASPAIVQRPANPELSPAFFSAGPTVDGQLNDECWKSAAAIGPFFKAGQTAGAAQQTDVRVGYDKANLYLGVTCWESQMDRLRAEFDPQFNGRDQNVFQDDALDLLIQPGSGPYWRLSTNVLGALYDARILATGESRAEFNLQNSRVAIARMSNRWLIEVAIPFHSLAPRAPSVDVPWGFNVCRNERRGKEISTWAPLATETILAPDRFGRLVVAEDLEPKLPQLQLPELVGCWSGESVAGGWVGDRSGHGHHAYAVGQVTAVPGKYGPAIDLAAGYLSVDDADELDLGNAYTLALWVKPKGIGGTRIFDKGKSGHSNAYTLDTYPQNNLRFLAQAVGISTSNETLPADDWSHVAVTCENGTVRLYLNGQLLKEQTGVLETPVPNSLPLRIGADSDGALRFQGLIEDLRIYRRALAPQEITALVKI